MSELSESALAFVRSWINERNDPCRVPVLKSPYRVDYSILSDSRVNVRVVENKRFIFPAPWTGKKELYYFCRVAFLDDEPIAVSRSKLGETGKPYYDPTQWFMTPGVAQALSRIS